MSSSVSEAIGTARGRLEVALGGLVQMLTRLRPEHRNALLERITPHLEAAREAAERLVTLQRQPGPDDR